MMQDGIFYAQSDSPAFLLDNKAAIYAMTVVTLCWSVIAKLKGVWDENMRPFLFPKKIALKQELKMRRNRENILFLHDKPG